MFRKLLLILSNTAIAPITDTDLRWHPPDATGVNDLSNAVNSSGIHGFIFNTSVTPDGQYGGYNFCNMPHVRRREYKKPGDRFELKYVEVIHRHHKRTPYQHSTFPLEPYSWNCPDQNLFYYGGPKPSNSNHSAHTYWQTYQSPSNPFRPSGFQNSTCQFPQITKEGLDDSWRHGRDLWEVYGELLGFLSGDEGAIGRSVVYRVTGNVITSQVSGMVINGMFGARADVPLLKQPSTVDSLEPMYPCSSASKLFDTTKNTPCWNQHLAASQPLFQTLDNISSVSPSSTPFHISWDHYFDNLSARLCHRKPLPCNPINPSLCVTLENAYTVFRLGEWEYSYIYRDSPNSLKASVGSYGVWIAELAQNIRDAIAGRGEVIYRHNVAHDGSLARLLSILQIDVMVWPGMGSEVVFEVWRRKDGGDWYLRVLWGGKVLRSSSPQLGAMDMVPIDRVLRYFDGLVGAGASEVAAFCTTS
ncbi:MAG: hypothetical protein M1840_009089 [Geoglossum simile]|nr:MAG: hypothetical protein M1840_009089 [Geoglossum simile]